LVSTSTPRGWSEQEVIDLYRFIDWVLTLLLEIEAAFRDDLETYKRGENMPYISAIERMGIPATKTVPSRNFK
jgi:hypothetical protein